MRIQGDITDVEDIKQVCERQNISMSALNAALEKTMQKPNSDSPKFDFWSLDLLADYIEKKHHRYIKGKTPEIQAYPEKICRVHGKAHPELMEVRQLFAGAAHELVMHMHKEEAMLFPFIRILAEAELEGRTNIGRPHFGTVGNPIKMMMHEHDYQHIHLENNILFPKSIELEKTVCHA